MCYWVKRNIIQWILCASLLFITVLVLTKDFPAPHITVESCLAAANVPLLEDNSLLWNQTTTLYNRRVSSRPAVIVLAENTDQIQAAVVCGTKFKLRVTAKGRGHGFGSHALGGEDGHLVIAVENMNKIHLVDGVAKIQPGARLGDIALELFSQGNRAIAHGECPSVGISGHVLHGGIGMASRTHGLTLDWLVGATVVLSNGSIAHCSTTENSDLFWAIRGAGSSFGIVTEFEFNTFEAPNEATVFTIESKWSQDQALRGLKALQDLMSGAPKELNFLLFLANFIVTIKGVYYGDQDNLRRILRPFIEDTESEISSLQTVGWIKSLERFSFYNSLGPAQDEHDTFYVTSMLTRSISDNQLESFTSTLYSNMDDNNEIHSWTLFMEFIGGQDSVVSSISPSDTSYAHRDKSTLIQLFSRPPRNQPYPTEGFAQIKEFRESISNYSNDGDWGMYANYIDTEVNSDIAPKLYWGSNLERLKRIKADVDPADVFWSPQGIRPGV